MKQNGKKLSSQNGKSKSLAGNDNGKATNGKGEAKKITVEREPFLFQLYAEGRAYRFMVTAFTEEYRETIGLSTIHNFIQKNLEKANQYRDAFYENKKAIPLANSSVRLHRMHEKAEKLGAKIDEILLMNPRQWQELNIALLMREWRELIAQLQDEAGDKITKFKGEGLPPISNYFGDVIVNTYADKAIEARRKEGASSGNRLKTAGFSDFGNPLSSN